MELVNDFKRATKLFVSDCFLHFIQYKYPVELQFPITYLCNFDCVMCGMHRLINKKHMSIDDIKTILSDKLFCKIESVGINGGEPFLRDDLVECIDAVVSSLPRLKRIFIISNGYYTERIVNYLKKIKEITVNHGLELTVSFSVDGVGAMQDFMRGRKNAFEKVEKTIEEVTRNRDEYCDHLNVICTITKHNVYSLPEVELWGEAHKIDISYNIATINERIDNHEKFEDFTIFNDFEAKKMASEFFYKQYLSTHNEKYYALFVFAETGKRVGPCTYSNGKGVTLTPDGNLCYCATHSELIGNVMMNSPYSLFQKNTKYRVQMCKEYCHGCSHYLYGLNSSGLKSLMNEKRIKRETALYRKKEIKR